MTGKQSGSSKLITDEQLAKELESGKTQKQIAEEYGYGHPSRALSDRIRSLGYDVRQRLNENGNDYYIPPSTVEKAIERAGLDADGIVYFDDRIADDGTIEVRPTENKWRKEDE